jgi:hypothetical protein
MIEEKLELFHEIAGGNIRNRRAFVEAPAARKTSSYVRSRRTLFVHIGTHKTGTTSIQNFLRRHSTRLRECGVFVPKAGTLNPTSGHHNIAWEIRKDPRYNPRIDGVAELVEELKTSNESTAVISSEDFEYLVQYPSELKAFDDRVEAAGFSTKYVVYFRERDSYARSLYCELEVDCELEVARLADNFDEFRQSIEKLGYVRVNGDWYYEFSYDRFVKNWENILGPKVRAYNYDESVQAMGLLPSFLLTIGASKQLIDESRRAPSVNTMFDKFQQMAHQLATMSDKLQQVSHQLAAVENSRSWRITAPLRGTVSFFIRLSHRLAKRNLAAELDPHSFAGGLKSEHLPVQVNDDALDRREKIFAR